MALRSRVAFVFACGLAAAAAAADAGCVGECQVEADEDAMLLQSKVRAVALEAQEVVQEAGTGFDCDFESTDSSPFCGVWANEAETDQMDWRLRSGPTPSSGTGPSGGADGSSKYLYIETSSPVRSGDKATLTATGISLTTGGSLEFKYSMHGGSCGTLKVEVEGTGGRDTVFEERGNKGDEWLDAYINLNAYANQAISIHITADKGRYWNGDIAIDSIAVQTVAPSTTTMAPTPTDVDCDFESASEPYCGLWQQSSDDKFDWTRMTGPTPSAGTGPDAAASGSYYMYIEASSPRRNGDHAILESVPVQLKDGASLTLKYHMRGAPGSLKVGFAADGEEEVEYEWYKNRDQGDQWHDATVDLSEFSGKSGKLLIYASKSYHWKGDIAIDKVFLHRGLAPGETTTTATTIAGTTTTGAGGGGTTVAGTTTTGAGGGSTTVAGTTTTAAGGGGTTVAGTTTTGAGGGGTTVAGTTTTGAGGGGTTVAGTTTTGAGGGGTTVAGTTTTAAGGGGTTTTGAGGGSTTVAGTTTAGSTTTAGTTTTAQPTTVTTTIGVVGNAISGVSNVVDTGLESLSNTVNTEMQKVETEAQEAAVSWSQVDGLVPAGSTTVAAGSTTTVPV